VAKNERKWKPWKPPPGKIDKPHVPAYYPDGPRVDKKGQAAFEKHSPYCLYEAGRTNEVACFKTKAQAEREMRRLHKGTVEARNNERAACKTQEDAYARWVRGANQLAMPKSKGSLRDATLALKEQLDIALAKQLKVVKICKKALESHHFKSRVLTIKKYTRGSNTRKALKNPRSPGHTWHSAQAKKKGAHHGR
jgi:hypothetical protein